MKAGNSSNPTETVKKTGQLQSSLNYKLERKVVNEVSDEHHQSIMSAEYIISEVNPNVRPCNRVSHVLKCYSQYSRFKLYPCNKTRIPPADPHIIQVTRQATEIYLPTCPSLMIMLHPDTSVPIRITCTS